MFDLGSAWRGIRAMHPNGGDVPAGWSIRFSRKSEGFWCDFWTPTWHDGRGPYLSIGLWFVFIYRGY